MRGVVTVFVVFALTFGLLLSAFEREPDWVQRFVLAYPLVLVWGVWSVGYLLGPKRRAATLAVAARLSWQLRLRTRLYRLWRRRRAAPGRTA